jgi:hypothetical protein
MSERVQVILITLAIVVAIILVDTLAAQLGAMP